MRVFDPQKANQGAWPDWIKSEEGKRCADVSTLTGSAASKFLENRLWAAFVAGAKAGRSEKKP